MFTFAKVTFFVDFLFRPIGLSSVCIIHAYLHQPQNLSNTEEPIEWLFGCLVFVLSQFPFYFIPSRLARINRLLVRVSQT